MPANFGAQLISQNIISEEQLKQALDEQHKTDESLDKIILRLGFVKEENFLSFLADELKLRFEKLDRYIVDPHIVPIVPEALARKYELIPMFKLGDTLSIAMSNPLDIEAINEVRKRTGLKVERIVSTRARILQAIDQSYGSSESMPQLVKDILGEDEKEMAKLLEGAGEDAPIIELVNLIIIKAIRSKASDIHIESEVKTTRIRYRLDGVMQEIMNLPKVLENSIISRVKVIAHLDITEKRMPQDGRLQMIVDGREIDLRVSVIPTMFGEKIVIRILDRAVSLLKLDQLGFGDQDLVKFDKIINKTTGIILVTGPTGSGKTTTLYAVLDRINSSEKNIVTIEDPIEYHIKGINQIQVHPKVGLNFSKGLRSVFRQDPDIIMVGEIRDLETAEIAVQASLTGHLVFSTIHTNNAAGAITRWIDLGIRPFLIASTLVGVLAQRLVRKICSSCKESYTPTKEVLAAAKLTEKSGGYTFYKGRGCKNCNYTGYTGRIGIFELFVIDEKARDMIVSQATTLDFEKEAVQKGMKTLRGDGIEKALQGITTIEEVLRTTGE